MDDDYDGKKLVRLAKERVATDIVAMRKASDLARASNLEFKRHLELAMRMVWERRRMEGLLMPDTKKMHRTLIDIVGIRDDIVIARIPGWNPSVPVAFDLNLVPDDLRDDVKADTYLIADVNIGANQASDLRFANFEWCPPAAEIE